MANTPITVTDQNGKSITVLADDFCLGISNAAGTQTTLLEQPNGRTVLFEAAISTLPAEDFLFVTSAKSQGVFSAGQSIALNKEFFKESLITGSGCTLLFKTTLGAIEVTESQANVKAQLQPTSGGSGTFRTLSDDVVSEVDGGITTIQNGVVSNAKLATVPTATLKGKNTAGTGAPLDLTVAQVKTMLALENVDNTTDANKPISSATQSALDAKQATLVSATNIKTINGNSLLGSGDLVVSGGSSLTTTTVGTATFQYEILTGTPVISYTKTGGSGVGTMGVTGGTIKLRRFVDDILTADTAANAIKFELVGTGTNYKLARPTPTKYTLNATDALADASTNATVSNQVDIDNTPPVKYGNIVITGHGSITIRMDNVTTDTGIDFKW